MSCLQMYRLIAIAAALLLSSCFDLHEEVWVEKDGSGRFAFDYRVPTSALFVVGGEEGIRKRLDTLTTEIPDLKLDYFELTEDGNESRLQLLLSTDSVLALKNIQSSEFYKDMPKSGMDLSGDVEVEIDGLDISLSRAIDIKGAVGFAALSISRKDRAERKVQYIYHLPSAAKTHNADRVENGGKTLIWERSLGEALKEPIVTEFSARIPIPWWAYAAVTAIVLIIIYGIYRIIRKVRMKNQALA